MPQTLMQTGRAPALRGCRSNRHVTGAALGKTKTHGSPAPNRTKLQSSQAAALQPPRPPIGETEVVLGVASAASAGGYASSILLIYLFLIL